MGVLVLLTLTELEEDRLAVPDRDTDTVTVPVLLALEDCERLTVGVEEMEGGVEAVDVFEAEVVRETEVELLTLFELPAVVETLGEEWGLADLPLLRDTLEDAVLDTEMVLETESVVLTEGDFVVEVEGVAEAEVEGVLELLGHFEGEGEGLGEREPEAEREGVMEVEEQLDGEAEMVLEAEGCADFVAATVLVEVLETEGQLVEEGETVEEEEGRVEPEEVFFAVGDAELDTEGVREGEPDTLLLAEAQFVGVRLLVEDLDTELEEVTLLEGEGDFEGQVEEVEEAVWQEVLLAVDVVEGEAVEEEEAVETAETEELEDSVEVWEGVPVADPDFDTLADAVAVLEGDTDRVDVFEAVLLGVGGTLRDTEGEPVAVVVAEGLFELVVVAVVVVEEDGVLLELGEAESVKAVTAETELWGEEEEEAVVVVLGDTVGVTLLLLESATLLETEGQEEAEGVPPKPAFPEDAV